MLQENPSLGIFVAMLHLVECIERQLVMRAVGVRGIDNSKKRGHHGLGLTADHPCLRESGVGLDYSGTGHQRFSR